MFKVMQQYGTVAQPATVYYCDDEADLQNIKSAPMGAQALVIHTGNMHTRRTTSISRPTTTSALRRSARSWTAALYCWNT